jgi:AcrR family transcriptional regulator
MRKKARISVRDLEQETKKFLAPATEKEKSILEAAIALISERGIDGATTAEIAKRANVTEKTLFRYFPSKTDLVRRVLFPLLLRVGLMRNWENFETFLRTGPSNAEGFRNWYVMLATDRLSTISRNPGLGRMVLLQIAQNEELRDAMEKVWRQHIWRPMVDRLEKLKADGAIRKDLDAHVLARAIHCLHIGYFLTRFFFAPDRDWDDAAEIEKMAEILVHGSSTAPTRASRGRKLPAAE